MSEKNPIKIALIHSCVDGHLGWLPKSSILHTVAEDTDVQVSLWNADVESFMWIAKKVVTGSYSRWNVMFLRDLHNESVGA